MVTLKQFTNMWERVTPEKIHRPEEPHSFPAPEDKLRLSVPNSFTCKEGRGRDDRQLQPKRPRKRTAARTAARLGKGW